MTAAGKQVDRLVRMANQIALNIGGSGGAEAIAPRVGDHLTRFWTPAMREQLLAYHRRGGGDLAPAVEDALHLIGGAE